MQLLEDSIAATCILALGESVVQQTILLRQQHRIKLPDVIIAATAAGVKPSPALRLASRTTFVFLSGTNIWLYQPK